MKKVAVVNIPECPTLATHYPACMEFIEGFTSFGYTTSSVTTLQECSDKDILVLSDHRINIPFLHEINKCNPNAVYILWCYHRILDKIPFKKYILTGEYFHRTPRMAGHIQFDIINKQCGRFVPLMLLANEDPEKIGTYEKKLELDGCFMGTPYKQHWVSNLPNILYHNINISGLLSYNDRRKNHLRSKIAFGFTSDANILNYHPTQRIFEGLAYGCVVISDNEAARDMTDGIVEYAATEEEFINKYNYFLTHPEACKEKEIAGYEWSKCFGTNRYTAKLFLNKIIELKY